MKTKYLEYLKSLSERESNLQNLDFDIEETLFQLLYFGQQTNIMLVDTILRKTFNISSEKFLQKRDWHLLNMETLNKFKNRKGFVFNKESVFTKTNIEEICKIKSLEKLTFKEICFDFSENYKNLTNLKFIEFFDVNDIPNFYFDIPNLTEIKIKNSNLKEIPKNILNLEFLHFLELQNCQISEIPQNIKNLQNLKVLDLNGNEIKEIPNEIMELNLDTLYLKFNKLKVIPNLLAYINTKKLGNTTFYLENNHFQNLSGYDEKIYDLKNKIEKIQDDNFSKYNFYVDLFESFNEN